MLFIKYTFILGNELTRQNRIILFTLISGSILLLLTIIIGAPFYYWKYSRGDNKSSISKNPNYGLLIFFFDLINFLSIHLELYTPDQWEIDKDSVTLDKLIGQGHFGQVYQGVLKLQDGTLTPCAVKVKLTKDSFIRNYVFFQSFEQPIQLIYYKKHQ
jgi:hypothetical protein